MTLRTDLVSTSTHHPGKVRSAAEKCKERENMENMGPSSPTGSPRRRAASGCFSPSSTPRSGPLASSRAARRSVISAIDLTGVVTGEITAKTTAADLTAAFGVEAYLFPRPFFPQRSFEQLQGGSSYLQPRLSLPGFRSWLTGFPLSALMQRVLVEQKFMHLRGRVGLTTPFILLFQQAREEGVWRCFRGSGFALLHIYVQDWAKIWANGVLLSELGQRVVRWFTFFGSSSSSSSSQRALEDSEVIQSTGGGSGSHGTTTSDGFESAEENSDAARGRVERAGEVGSSENAGPERKEKKNRSAQLATTMHRARFGCKLFVEFVTYPLLVLANRAIFAPTCKGFFKNFKKRFQKFRIMLVL